MRKVKILDELDFDNFLVHSREFQAGINRMFEEIAKENGVVSKTVYLRGESGYLKTAIIEYVVNDEAGA